MDETRVRSIVADLLEDVVVAKPEDPISFLLETLKSEGTTVGDVELKRRLKEISTSEEQLLVIAKHFPKYRRQIKQALDNSKGNIDQFFTAAKEALAGPAGPLSI